MQDLSLSDCKAFEDFAWDQGWRPRNAVKFQHHIPYTPFSKTDRIGKIADWAPTDQDLLEKRSDDIKGRKRLGAQFEAFGAGVSSAFSYQIAEEADFSIVDRATVNKAKKGGLKIAPVASWGSKSSKKDTAVQAKKSFRNTPPARVRDTSIKMDPEWVQVEELDFARLNNLYFQVDDPIDLGLYGNLGYLDHSFEKLSAKSEKTLVGSGTQIMNQTSSEDPVLKNILSSQSSELLGKTVIITDVILASLMAATRSVYSWDIMISKKGNQLIFDKRENASLDNLSVNENSILPPTDDKDSMNSSIALAMESTFVDRVFKSQIVLKDQLAKFPNEIPWSCSVPILYRYRKWSLGGDISLYVRTHIDAAVISAESNSASGIPLTFESSQSKKETHFVHLTSLLEYDCRVSSTPDWRQKLESTRGAVLATEYKNNSFRLSSQVAEAMLSGVDQIRLGFLSRKNPKDRRRHDILSVQSYKPDDLATQLNFDIYSGWGIIKTLTDFLFSQPDGEYILIKSPNKPVIDLLKT